MRCGGAWEPRHHGRLHRYTARPVYQKPQGQPLHTRSLSLVVRTRGDRLVVRGDVIDLRKRGFMPLPGGVQPAGLIHHMHLDADVDPADGRLVSLVAAQPRVAFEPTPESRGECCRDPAERLQALVGQCFDDAFPKALSQTFGGPRGCSHLLTLFQLVASSVPGLLAREREAAFERARDEGEIVFQRMLVLDGFEPEEGTIQMDVQGTDVHTRPAPRSGQPIGRLLRQEETQVLAEVEMSGLSLAAIHASRRRRGLADYATAAWEDLDDRVAPLAGRPLMAGLAGELLRRFGGDTDARPLLDALLQLAPGFIQCMAATLDKSVERAAATDTRASDDDPTAGVGGAAIGGQADSCYMWRRDGALLRYRG